MIYQEYEVTTDERRGQSARVFFYIQAYTESIAVDKRPLVLICPGGAYAYTSDREAEPIALAFLAQGFHAAVLRYDCADYDESAEETAGDAYEVEPAARIGVARAVALVYQHAEEWHVDTSKIVLWGASAGGHLAAHYACTWYDEMPALTGLSRESLRIGGLMLAYPVITSGEKTHRDSIKNLLREKRNDPEERKRVSLENRVNGHVPPTFLWHTWTDGSVPVENSLLFAQALKEHDVQTELHIFPAGGHGLSLADERTVSSFSLEIEPCCQIWIDLACAWLKRLAGKAEAR
ncbi:MAG: alpha/beta hydrolase [Lachnospiraceae bacterium]|nr:alpha/beta hydrolase [Lachnospiraceae bacterium]